MSPKTAVILAAGTGSRLREDGQSERFSKPLFEVGSKTLLEHTLEQCSDVVEDIVVVTGYAADRVRARVKSWSGARIRTIENTEWTKPNGLSLSVCAGHVEGDFLLLMSDHLFDPTILRDLAAQPTRGGVVLAIDYEIDQVFDLDDATKVQLDGVKIVDIAKELPSYQAIDCGLFHCSQNIFGALARAQARGEMSLSHGMRELSQSSPFVGFDIGSRWWQDVDTPEMAAEAERRLEHAKQLAASSGS